ncbi:MAG: threonine--tRNA ligase [Alphaproteobacteria bacterium]|nr:threonine--tRNA ligase [Alphaproteobacteria bacterium]
MEVVLPDGSRRILSDGATAYDLAQDISPSLAKAALLAGVEGTVCDLATPLRAGERVAILTRKDDAILPHLRHSCAHILAEAVQNLFADVQITFGPATENGFYYDFHRKTPFVQDDLEKIEAEMHRIVQADAAFERSVWSRDQMLAWCAEHGETFKAEHVGNIPVDKDLSVYHQGTWMDMCRGPHVPSTGAVGKGFKLLKLAGAYWRGDANNPQLQRIYGTCWRDPKELKAYLHMLEEAEKRDHRRLGREMGLFHLQEAAAGSVFWHPRGWTLYRVLQDYMRARQFEGGYQEVKTPQLLDRMFWEKSGHWDKYRDDMFVFPEGASNKDSGVGKAHALKPMNCPCHVMIFRQGIKSYRDLPLRLAEFGSCHRNEASGALHGLMRVRAFTQDDAHIFCTPEQIADETVRFCALLHQVYRDFGFTDIQVLFSARPKVRVGSDEIWDQAEVALSVAGKAAGLEFQHNPGDGAFYGPKLDFVLRDAIGREWQCGTFQCDFVLPERLGASYVGSDGAEHHPVMLHRTIIGSFERFCGVLIEHHAGKLPMWLAPVQAMVCTISKGADRYAEEVVARFAKVGLRIESDLRNQKIGYKVREHSLQKIPALIVVGAKEAAEHTVVIRRLGSNVQKVHGLDTALNILCAEATPPHLRSKNADSGALMTQNGNSN